MSMPTWLPSSRTLARPIVALLLAVSLAACAPAQANQTLTGPASVTTGNTASAPTADLQDLQAVGDLQSRFNADAGHPRLMLLISPT